MLKQENEMSTLLNSAEFTSVREFFTFVDMQNYTQDFGHMISREPLAVFLPQHIEARHAPPVV